MGRLNIPRGSRLYLDTAPIIYSVEEHDVYWPELQPIWKALGAGELQVVTSEISLLETLVHPIRYDNSELADSYNELLTGGEVYLVPITASVLRTAAEFRAHQNFKTPDAIHCATALLSGCEFLIANDTGFRRLKNIEVIILSDLF